MTLNMHGRFDHGFAWMPRPRSLMEQSSTALAEGGRIWLVDPVRDAGLEEALQGLGKVVAVVMTIGWHDRDVGWFATLYGVPVYAHRSLYVLPHVKTAVERVDEAVPESPLRIIPCGGRGVFGAWRETAIWWPEQRTLVTGDSLGTASYFIQPGQEIAVHPLRRLSPPFELRDLPAERLFPGHGRSVHQEVAPQIARAVDRARRDLASSWLRATRALLRRYTGR